MAALPRIDAGQIGAAFTRASGLSDQLLRAPTRYDVVRLLVVGVSLSADAFAIEIDRLALLGALGVKVEVDEQAEPIILTSTAVRVRQHKDVRLIIGDADGNGTVTRNEPLVALLADARRAFDEMLAAPKLSIAALARAHGRCRKRLARLLRIAMLAPDIVERCLLGTQPASLSTATLLSVELPIAWDEQRRLLKLA